MKNKKCYGSYGIVSSQETCECPKCPLQRWCKEASDPELMSYVPLHELDENNPSLAIQPKFIYDY